MASDERPEPRRRRTERRRPLLQRLLEAFGPQEERSGGEGPNGGTAETVAADLVDQAEAFASLRVSDVMTPRADIVALELQTPLIEVVRRFVDIEHSRIPIYRDTLDDPIGVAHIKDVFKLIAPPEKDPQDPPPWGEPLLGRIRRQVLYVPASMRAADLLVRMRAARIHMAMVIDEYGGVDGLVTMEDLIEAVVGEIDDEHDEEAAAALVSRPGGVIEADARASLEDLEERLGTELAPPEDEEDIDTVGGLVVGLAGRVPQRGEVIVHPGGYEFEVLDADPRRIRRVRVRRTIPAGSEAPGEPAAGSGA